MSPRVLAVLPGHHVRLSLEAGIGQSASDGHGLAERRAER